MFKYEMFSCHNWFARCFSCRCVSVFTNASCVCTQVCCIFENIFCDFTKHTSGKTTIICDHVKPLECLLLGSILPILHLGSCIALYS